MNNEPTGPAHGCGPVVKLDGRVLPLPPEALQSMGTLIASVERLALKRQRVLSLIRVDGRTLPFPGAVKELNTLQTIDVISVSFEQRSREILDQLLRRLEALEEQLVDTALVVMINPLPAVLGVWANFVAQLRSILLEVGLLEELCRVSLAGVFLGGKSVADHLNEIGSIQAAAELLLKNEDGIPAFSDLLEHEMAAWVRMLALLLKRVPDAAVMLN